MSNFGYMLFLHQPPEKWAECLERVPDGERETARDYLRQQLRWMKRSVPREYEKYRAALTKEPKT